MLLQRHGHAFAARIGGFAPKRTPVAFRLIPKEEKFYDDFRAVAEQITKGAALLEQMVATDPLITSVRFS